MAPEDILAQARRGDLRALEALIRTYQVPVGRFVISLLGPDGDYLDVCQITFLQMMRGLPRLRDAEVFEPWLYRIARNACTDHLRRRRRDRQNAPLRSAAMVASAPEAEPERAEALADHRRGRTAAGSTAGGAGRQRGPARALGRSRLDAALSDSERPHQRGPERPAHAQSAARRAAHLCARGTG